MPIYTYHCGGCERTSERLVKRITDTPACPHCGHPLRQIVLSVPSPAQWACNKGSS